jgi:hypothetical protein
VSSIFASVDSIPFVVASLVIGGSMISLRFKVWLAIVIRKQFRIQVTKVSFPSLLWQLPLFD